jgi:hypothetical protein
MKIGDRKHVGSTGWVSGVRLGAAEVGFDHFRVGLHCGRISFGDLLAEIEHGDAVLANLAHDGDQLLDVRRRQARGRLVLSSVARRMPSRMLTPMEEDPPVNGTDTPILIGSAAIAMPAERRIADKAASLMERWVVVRDPRLATASAQ